MSPMSFGSILAVVALCVGVTCVALPLCVVAGLLLPWWVSLPAILALIVGVVWAARKYVFGIR
jgi:hypothetical protein